MNIQMQFYESILNGMRVTAHLNQLPLAVRRKPQRHFYVRLMLGWACDVLESFFYNYYNKNTV